MDELLSEKEQIDMMRSWWKENGTYVVVGILIGVGGIFGLNQWRTGTVEQQMAASVQFEAVAEEIAENRLESAEMLASEIYADHPDSIYTDQTRLAMARLYMDQGRDQDAAQSLSALVDGNGDREMQLVARLRLAKVLLYQGRSEEVLTLLEGHTDSGLGARFQEAIGDAHTELGNYQQAEEAYMAALNDPLASQLVDTSLLQMKIGDLPDVLAEGATATPDGAVDGDVSTVDAPDGADDESDDAMTGPASSDAESPQAQPEESVE